MPAIRRGVWISILVPLLGAACGGGGGGSGGPPVAGTPAEAPPDGIAPADPGQPLDVRSFRETPDDVLNPERGGFYWVDLPNARGLSSLRGKGATLGFASVSLASYRSQPLDAAFLDRLSAGFRAARMAGVKVILRFKYSSSISEPDAPKAWILHHIGQLRPLLEANADVIAVLQAGFIGAWGEWHHSSNGLDNPQDRSDILHAILAALPATRMTQIRTPNLKAQILGEAPLSGEEAFTGTPRARVGHHNDAFLGSANDMGTYPSPVESWKDRLAQDGRFVPVGGETAALNPPRTDGPEAIREMARLHWSFLNLGYHSGVLSQWGADGSLAEIRRRLGYRFSLLEATWSRAARAGGRLDLAVRLRNDGFAAPFNERPLFVVLTRDPAWVEAPIRTVDPCRWEPGAEHEFAASVQLPASLAAGIYRLGLWLPDPAPALRARPEYSVRFANEGVWDAASGLNVLTDTIAINGAGP